MWNFLMFLCAFIVFVVVCKVDATPRRLSRQKQPNGRSTSFEEIVRKTGYFVEEHFVTTSDGYILSIHRIFGGPKSQPMPGKPLVLLIHGMVASSDVWVMRGPAKDLVYLLSDEGFDVWLLNVRGNSYSRQHIRISPKCPEFWRFSWHENGVYDLPATVDYVLAKTRLNKVTLIGHSMGTTAVYVFLSIRPEYNEKVDLVVSLAPIAIFTHQYRGPALAIGLKVAKAALTSFRRNGVVELLSHADVGSQLISAFCSRPGAKTICRETIFLISGSVDREQFDDALIPSLLEHYPAGTSLDTVEHYRQNLVNQSFRQFDFGRETNYLRYGNFTPPEYPLKKITAPVILYYGLNDPLSHPSDVEALARVLPNLVASKLVPWPNFNHFDFVISKDSKTLLYDDVIAVIKKYKGAQRKIRPHG